MLSLVPIALERIVVGRTALQPNQMTTLIIGITKKVRLVPATRPKKMTIIVRRKNTKQLFFIEPLDSFELWIVFGCFDAKNHYTSKPLIWLTLFCSLFNVIPQFIRII